MSKRANGERLERAQGAGMARSVSMTVGFVLVIACALDRQTHAASRVLAGQALADFNIASSNTVSMPVDFSTASNVSGFGLATDWTAVVADTSDGLYPWALDLRVTGTSPMGAALQWDPIGGDRTFADYPLADYSNTYGVAQPGGVYNMEFSTPGVPNPFVSGLRNTTIFAMGDVPDVATDYDGSVAIGPMWNRPFSISSISGLGPVVYDVLEFTVPVSGGYSFESVIPSSNNFNFLYRGAFDPGLPLDHLLDYGLGNGSAPNGTPQGTSLIEALLFAGETYFYVTSQFQQAIPGQAFETDIVGPAAIDSVPDVPSGDFDADGDYACNDVDGLVAQIVAGNNNVAFDLTGDGLVDGDDLTSWLAEAGAAELDSGASYLLGDANLDGVVDGADFLAWNTNKFVSSAAWCLADFNADGTTDGADFLLWNQFKFQSADRIPASVPEPTMAVWFIMVAALCGIHVQHGRAHRLSERSLSSGFSRNSPNDSLPHNHRL